MPGGRSIESGNRAMDGDNLRTDRVSDQRQTQSVPGRTRTGGLWVGLILSSVMLIFLLIFILQNRMPVQISFLGWTGTLPTAIALLFAAIAGILLLAIPGGVRMLQLRRATRSMDRGR